MLGRARDVVGRAVERWLWSETRAELVIQEHLDAMVAGVVSPYQVAATVVARGQGGDGRRGVALVGAAASDLAVLGVLPVLLAAWLGPLRWAARCWQGAWSAPAIRVGARDGVADALADGYLWVPLAVLATTVAALAVAASPTLAYFAGERLETSLMAFLVAVHLVLLVEAVAHGGAA
mgnify:CR=1 FL=1